MLNHVIDWSERPTDCRVGLRLQMLCLSHAHSLQGCYLNQFSTTLNRKCILSKNSVVKPNWIRKNKSKMWILHIIFVRVIQRLICTLYTDSSDITRPFSNLRKK